MGRFFSVVVVLFLFGVFFGFFFLGGGVGGGLGCFVKGFFYDYFCLVFVVAVFYFCCYCCLFCLGGGFFGGVLGGGFEVGVFCWGGGGVVYGVAGVSFNFSSIFEEGCYECTCACMLLFFLLQGLKQKTNLQILYPQKKLTEDNNNNG